MTYSHVVCALSVNCKVAPLLKVFKVQNIVLLQFEFSTRLVSVLPLGLVLCITTSCFGKAFGMATC
jgi:hypothetical protein